VPLKLAADFAPLDIAAALTADGKALTVAIVNPTAEARALPLALAGRTASGPATRWLVAGTDERARNEPGRPRTVDIVRTEGISAAEPLAVPALGCALFVIPLK